MPTDNRYNFPKKILALEIIGKAYRILTPKCDIGLVKHRKLAREAVDLRGTKRQIPLVPVVEKKAVA